VKQELDFQCFIKHLHSVELNVICSLIEQPIQVFLYVVRV